MIRVPPPSAAQQLTVTDGDTIRLGDERIRLEAIDAPETAQPECLAERLLGEATTRRLVELVAVAGSFQIVRSGVDQYGRTLAVVFVAGVDVARQLIVEGLAMPWTGRQVDWCHP